MFNYILADLKRIALRIPRALVMVAIYAILIIVLVIASKGQWNAVTFVLAVEQYIEFLPVLIGLVELISVFTEDFKAKTMQVAIGIGIPRYRIVLSKLIEMMLLVLVDLMFVFVIALITGAIMQVWPDGQQLMAILGNLFGTWMGAMAYASLTMILIFFTQGMGIATLLYLAFCGKIVYTLLDIIFSIEIITSLHLQRFTLTAMIQLFNSKILLGTFSTATFLGILLYIVLGYLGAVAVFNRRELDF